MIKIAKFFLCLILCLGGGWMSGLVTQNGLSSWYPHLIKSPLTPPSYIFPIAWTILYFLMATSLWLLWTSSTKKKVKASVAFGLQLGCNFSWSTLFFYVQSPLLALIDISFLWPLIVCTMLFFWRHTKGGALLFIPYLLWSSFAFYLNLFIWVHN